MPTTGVGQMACAGRLVVEADVAADDGRAEGAAGLGHALDDLGQLVVDRGVVGRAEVEAVGDRHRGRADAGDVARRLGHGDAAALARLEVAEPAVAVGG